jgi:hypothetical protein
VVGIVTGWVLARCIQLGGRRDSVVIGVVGLVLPLTFWSGWGEFGRRELYVDGSVCRRVADDDYD